MKNAHVMRIPSVAKLLSFCKPRSHAHFSGLLAVLCLCMLGLSAPAHAQSQFAGVYMGSFSDKEDFGDFAIISNTNGIARVFWFNWVDEDGGEVTGIPVNANGNFSFVTPDGDEVLGTMSANALSGTYTNGGSFSANKSPTSGAFASSGGLYRGTTQGTGESYGTEGTFSGKVIFVVDAVGKAFFWSDSTIEVDGEFYADDDDSGRFTVSSGGSINFTTGYGTSVTGFLNKVSRTASGSTSWVGDPEFPEDEFTNGTWSASRKSALPNTPPTVAITQPFSNTTFTAGEAIRFRATAEDTEDGDLSSSLTWESTLDGIIGSGASITRSRLSVGRHFVVARVKDSGNLLGDAGIFVTVEALPLELDGPNLTSVSDESGDSLPDIAVHTSDSGNTVSLVSGSDGSLIRDINFFNSNWTIIDLATVSDSNGDGVANDSAIAVLGLNNISGKAAVRVRAIVAGTPQIGDTIDFTSSEYQPIDIAVVDDTNGDGVPNDPSIAVLAERTSTGRQAVILKSLANGAQIGNWTITQPDQDLLAVVGVSLAGGESRVGVLVRNRVTSKTKVRSIHIGDGQLLPNTHIAGGWFAVQDLAVQRDYNGNGVANDPVYVVLGRNSRSDQPKLRLIDVLTKTRLVDHKVLTSNWQVHSVAVSSDLSGDNREDVLTIATRKEFEKLIINVKELDSGDSVKNLYPVVD